MGYFDHNLRSDNMKLLFLSCLAVVSHCAPQLLEENEKEPVAILRQQFSLDGANFQSGFLSEDDTSFAVVGTEGGQGQSNQQGSWEYTLDDGSVAEYRYTADENGYRPDSSLIPVGPALPSHVVAQLQYVQEQQARGLTWDQETNSWI